MQRNTKKNAPLRKLIRCPTLYLNSNVNASDEEKENITDEYERKIKSRDTALEYKEKDKQKGKVEKSFFIIWKN